MAQEASSSWAQWGQWHVGSGKTKGVLRKEKKRQGKNFRLPSEADCLDRKIGLCDI